MDQAHTQDRRRRRRDYPLPLRGIRSQDLTGHLTLRDRRHAVRNGFLEHLLHGLYGPTVAEEQARHFGLLQALTANADDTVSHSTAAILHGAIDQPLQPPFHITSPRGNRRIRRPGVTGHRIDIPEAHIVSHLDVRFTSPAWTWTDLALRSTLLEALVLADIFIRPGRPEFGQSPEPLVTRAQLQGALRLRGRANGVRIAAQALELAREGVDSPQETRLRFYMGEAGLPEAEVNMWICDDEGHPVVQPDLSIVKYRIALQYEGWEFHSNPDQMARDVRRQERTEALGWIEVRITREHMRNGGAEAISKIRRALFRQGWRPSAGRSASA